MLKSLLTKIRNNFQTRLTIYKSRQIKILRLERRSKMWSNNKDKQIQRMKQLDGSEGFLQVFQSKKNMMVYFRRLMIEMIDLFLKQKRMPISNLLESLRNRKMYLRVRTLTRNLTLRMRKLQDRRDCYLKKCKLSSKK